MVALTPQSLGLSVDGLLLLLLLLLLLPKCCTCRQTRFAICLPLPLQPEIAAKCSQLVVRCYSVTTPQRYSPPQTAGTGEPPCFLKAAQMARCTSFTESGLAKARQSDHGAIHAIVHRGSADSCGRTEKQSDGWLPSAKQRHAPSGGEPTNAPAHATAAARLREGCVSDRRRWMRWVEWLR